MIKVAFNVEKPLRLSIGELLTVANDGDQAEQVAQHLVGANLSLRFPKIEVENHLFTTADITTGRGGAFIVGDTFIHVTMLPTPAVFEECGSNIRNGYRSLLLVPEAQLIGAHQNAELNDLHDKVGIHSIESFVGQNVEEMGEFAKAKLADEFRTLLITYNERVAAVETDLSFLIEIPENL
jgi:hypothetical protein